MACASCGESANKCTCGSHAAPAVLEIVNEAEVVLFRKVIIPASVGDETTNPPRPGMYSNTLVVYEASGEAYLYSSDCIPTKITDKSELKRLETLIGNEVADRYNADVNLQNQINDIPKELPVASATVLGGIKVGNNLTISEDGTLSAQAGGGSGDIVYDRDSNGQPIGVNISENYARYIKIGNNSTSGKGVTVVIGDSAVADKDNAVALGYDAKATNYGSVALGYNTTASGNQSVVLGSAAYATASHATAIGHDANATGEYSISLGDSSHASATNSVSIGNNSYAQGNYGTSIGNSAHADAEKSVAIGSHANSNKKESVAIGYDSSNSREKEVSVGSSSIKRYIANVEDGELDNDAVNKKQLDALSDRVDELSLVKAPNVTIIGNPTINQGQASAFTTANYLQFPFVLDMTGKTFQIDFCFTTGQQVATQQNLIDSKFGIALAIENNVGVMSISSNGTSWNIGTARGTTILQPNTTYFARLSWNGTTYKTALSTDGVTYTDDMTIASSSAPFPTTHYIGGVNSTVIGHTAHPFGGTIDLNKCKLTVNNELVWEGMDSAGLRTRADISLSNIDAAAEEKIREIMAPIVGDVESVLARLNSGAGV